MASIKVSELQATTSAADNSFLYVADTVNGTEFDSKKITVANFLGAYATEAFVNSAISDLINGAPEALDTLKEISDAIGDSGDIVGNLLSMVNANETHVDNMATLSGVLKDAVDLGAFTGSTIADAATIKEALQALETSLETKGSAALLNTTTSRTNDLIALSGVAGGSVDLGEFTGFTLSDNATLKTVLQDAETAIEANAAANAAEEAARIAADAAEEAARIAADGNLQTALNAEEAARIAGDALKLNLSGGTMSGDIVFGGSADAVWNPETENHWTIDGSTATRGMSGGWNTVTSSMVMSAGTGTYNWSVTWTGLNAEAPLMGMVATDYSADHLGAPGSLRILKSMASAFYHPPVGDTVRHDGVNILIESGVPVNFSYNSNNGAVNITANGVHLGVTFYVDTSIDWVAAAAGTVQGYVFELDQAGVAENATIGANGSASFSGNISAPAAPTAGEHLVNKAYLDSLDNENDALIAANTAAINAEEAARIAADGVLQDNIDAEEAARIAAVSAEASARTAGDATLQANIDAEAATRQAQDALLLPLAGGTMSGAIQMGEGGTETEFYSEINPNVDATVTDLTKIVVSGKPGQPVYVNAIKIDGVYVAESDGWTVTSSTGSLSGLANLYNSAGTVNLLSDDYSVIVASTGASDVVSLTLTPPSPVSGSIRVISGRNEQYTTLTEGGGGSASVIGVDGTASFGGAVSAATAPTADEHLANKLYVDGKAAVNAAAIEAVVGGAPELLNTLNELAQAIADDENFSATVTNLITTETSARTAADNTLQNNINTVSSNLTQEIADRTAADALKLDLAGGNVTGTLNVGTGSVVSAYTSGAVAASGRTNYPPVSFFDGDLVNYGVRFQRFASDTEDPSISFNQLTATSSVRLYVVDMSDTWNHGAPYLTVNGIQTMQADYDVSARFAGGDGWHDVSSFLTFPINVTSVGLIHGGGQDFKYVDIRAIEIDGVLITEGMQITTPGGVATTFNPDGSASFSGLVSAATAPTADEHLTNKLYVDTLHETDSASLTAEIAARIAGDTTLQNNIDAESTARVANDALKLDLAGGTMSGDINFGGVAETTGAYVSNVVAGGESDLAANLFVDGSSFKLRAGAPTTFTPIVAQSSVKISTYGVYPQYSNDFQIRINGEPIGHTFTGQGIGYRSTLILDDVTFPFTVSNISVDGEGGTPSRYAWVEHIEIDGVPVYEGTVVTMAGEVSATQLRADGSATFSGLISAATAPTADEHLTNKLYVDNKAAVNAAAIEAVVGGAPELLNTLNELAQAISDDENFSTTVTNLISTETSARQAADTTLQSNIDAESAARIAADNTLTASVDAKLPLAGGTMTGAIQMGVAGTQYVSNITSRTTVEGNDINSVFNGVISEDQDLNYRFVSTASTDPNADTSHYVSFEPLEVTTSLRVWVDTTTSGIDLNMDTGNVVSFTENNGNTNNDGLAWVTLPVTTPFTLSSIGRATGTSGWFYIGGIEVDGVVITEGMMLGGGGSVSTLNIDGTATFGGAVTAATAPSANDHLTNKLYVDTKHETSSGLLDAEVAARTAADTALQNNIDAEEAARIAADNVLTTNLAQEVADRAAGDALLLPLAGGTMSGAINLGSPAELVAGPATSGAPTFTLATGSGTIESITIVATANNVEFHNLIIDDVVVDDESLGDYVTGAGFNNGHGLRAFDGSLSSKAQGPGGGTMVFTPATPIPYTSKVEVKTGAYNTVTMVNGEAAGLSVLGVDGTASFAGAVTAPTAPTSDVHLTNKLYVDNKAAVNAAAIEAVVGGAPELLNTLNELAQAISDDENFAATVAGNLAAETTARTSADTTLQANIDAEAASRIAGDQTLTQNLSQEITDRQQADALLLPLAGGTMSGAINLGQIPGSPTMSWVHTSNSTTTGPSCVIFDTGDNITVNKFKIEQAGDNSAVFQYSTNGSGWGSPGTSNTFEGHQRWIKVKTGGEDVGKTITVTLLESGGSDPIPWETKHHESANPEGFFSDVIDSGYVSVPGGGNSVLGVDGTASFSGLISAPTAPSADEHLTNKLYVDGLAASNTSAINTLTANLAQEVSDRTAGDATLTTNLAQEIADRIAAVNALTNGAVADNTAAITQEVADRTAADALKVDKGSLVNEHLIGQTSAQSAPVDAEGNSNYLFLVVDKATGALKSIDKTFLEAE